MIAGQAKVHRQHHVARFYLDGWATDEQLYCLRSNRVFQTNVRDAAVQRHFYRGRRLTAEDVQMIQLWIKKSPPQAAAAHEGFYKMFSVWAALRATLPTPLAAIPGLVDFLDTQIINAEENFHGKIETAAAPMIADARAGDLSFYADDARCIHFLHFLVLQLFRTRAVKEKVFRLQAEQGGYDLANCWNIISHICAANVGLTLFLERRRRPLILLENSTEVEFITGDQPVLNLFRGQGDAYSPYYPISPTRALMLGDPDVPSPFAEKALTVDDVRDLNRRIADASLEQIFGASCQSLAPFVLTPSQDTDPETPGR